MRLEILMKKRLISSLLNYYGEDIIKVFKNFFNNKNRLIRYNYSKGNSILAILKNPQIAKESQKFEKNNKHFIFVRHFIFISLL